MSYFCLQFQKDIGYPLKNHPLGGQKFYTLPIIDWQKMSLAHCLYWHFLQGNKVNLSYPKRFFRVFALQSSWSSKDSADIIRLLFVNNSNISTWHCVLFQYLHCGQVIVQNQIYHILQAVREILNTFTIKRIVPIRKIIAKLGQNLNFSTYLFGYYLVASYDIFKGNGRQFNCIFKRQKFTERQAVKSILHQTARKICLWTIHFQNRRAGKNNV